MSEAELDGGSYDVIRRRLVEQATELGAKAEALNKKRTQVFGGTELQLIANERVRTENNCVPRDIVSIAGHLLFGFQVFIGLKTETSVADVLSVYKFVKSPNQGADGGFDLSAQAFEGPAGFLADEAFAKDFRDTFRYTKEARLLQLRRTETRLLAAVQVGATARDAKVFRWSIDAAGRLAYMDARGDDDNAFPRSHGFVWTPTGRDDHVGGAHPHVNILDQLFVETVGGDLTIKVENNTKTGVGIYRESVDDANQTLDDADIAYAQIGALILLKILPYRETQYRYFVFNTRTKTAKRIDAIGQACVELAEDQGIVFPGGYYLKDGECRVFDSDTAAMELERTVRAPNGEDVLYVFYRREQGQYLLLPYNLIRKEVANPLRCNGYSLFADGTMALFRAEESAEPTRVHALQVWRTPFATLEHAAAAPAGNSYLAKVGNAELVRGISEALTLKKLASSDAPTRLTYEDAVATATRISHAYYWLGHAETENLAASVSAIKKTSELIIDEFEKMLAIRRRADEALALATTTQTGLLARLRPDDLSTVEGFLEALTELRKQRGALITLKELRGVDVARVAALDEEVKKHAESVSDACVGFFLKQNAFAPLLDRLDGLTRDVEAVAKVSDLTPFGEELARVQSGLTILAEVASGLKVDDATARTQILDGVSAAFAQLNRARSGFDARKRDLATKEGRAEFGVQFKLFGQAVVSALAICDTPERCDEELSRLLIELETIEGRFGELDEFAPDLATKREDVSEALGTRRQQLVDERHRRAQNLFSAAERILAGVGRKAATLKTESDLQAYFAADPMVHKLDALAEQLRAIGDSVRADEVNARIKSRKQESLRQLRDKVDLSEGSDDTIKLGNHRFSVQKQALELVLVPRDEVMTVHLTGTDFYEPVVDDELDGARNLWDETLVSESSEVYRGEYLAYLMLRDAEQNRGLSDSGLRSAVVAGTLEEVVRTYAADRLDEGYERGVHDHDAALILERLLALRESVGLLRYVPDARAFATFFFAEQENATRELLVRRARSAGNLVARFGHGAAQDDLARELEAQMHGSIAAGKLEAWALDVPGACRFLVQQIARDPLSFTTSHAADAIANALLAELDAQGARRAFEEDLRALEKHASLRLALAGAYVDAWLSRDATQPRRYAREAAVILALGTQVPRHVNSSTTEAEVKGLLGAHRRIAGRAMPLSIDEFLGRLGQFTTERVPRFLAYRAHRTEIVERERKRLRLPEFQARVLTSFVRNRLIDEVYLPLIGNNLAKQLGTVGDKKRTDLMGLLLLVSPPGYGKTTLMEYVASKLGLVFVKVNGPALGHDVTSLDPSECRNSTARQEVDKINLALEMGNNVMLYLDDIQHTSAELLQKFISLCDGQRRIEGVWKGQSRTYDLRGKKFCVVMAGNPYTESGTRFQIPDMLANRADTYNLGEILDGKADLFALSYLENALTSNVLTAPLATRDPKDVHRMVAMAKGETVAASEFLHGYAPAELEELAQLFRVLLKVQTTLLAVNRQYILSASQDDAYRTEPAFKLQGSYRNMNKLTEKVASAMNSDEIDRLVDDHYASESQTLTTGAEHNLLKLGELRGRMSPAQEARWQAVKETFARNKRMGGKGDDPIARVTGTLSGLDDQLKGIRAVLSDAMATDRASGTDLSLALLTKLEAGLEKLARPQLDVRVEQPTQPALVELVAQQVGLVERTLVPLVEAVARHQGNAALAIQLDALTHSVAKLDARLARGIAGAPRFDVEVSASSDSNFYLGARGTDVIEHGGVFVSTYGKVPGVGSEVTLRIAFPNGAAIELSGNVAFLQSHLSLSDDKSAGFGVRLHDVSDDARALIGEFTRLREPLVRDAG